MYNDLGQGQEVLLDPPSNGIDLLYDHWYVSARMNGSNPYYYASDNPTNRIDPLGLQEVDPRNLPNAGGGSTWLCQRQETQQTRGKEFNFHEAYVEKLDCCTDECTIQVYANRCFNISKVAQGDDSNPDNFFTTIAVKFTRTKRECGGNPLPDQVYYHHGRDLRPGRLVNPAGPLSEAIRSYLKTIKSCKDFNMDAMYTLVDKVPPPKTVSPDGNRQE